MITMFNRKELLVTMELSRQADVRRILTENNIPYVVKVTNLTDAPIISSNRGHQGSFGINQNYSYEYKIYVRKKDYDKAKGIIG